MSIFGALKENIRWADNSFPFKLYMHRRVNKHRIMRPHWQESDEIILIKRGTADFQIGTLHYKVSQGDILLVNNGQFHTGYALCEEVEFCAFVFHKSMLLNCIPDQAYMSHIVPYMKNDMIFPNHIGAGHHYYLALTGHLEQIIHEFDKKHPGYELMVRAQLLMFITLLSRYRLFVSRLQSHSNISERNLEPFIKLFDYLEQHYHEKVTLETAASLVNLSTYHFCKTFKKITGKTFVDYLNQYRINKAEELLRNTTLSISEIGDKVGFCNINYFNKMFRKYNHCPPSQFRDR